MLNIAVLASGGGTNLQAIIDRINDNYLDKCRIKVVISDRENAYALQRAKDNNIQSKFVSKQGKSVDEFDKELISILDRYGVQLIVMAGFMSILGERFVNNYSRKIINIHPSLIPSFCGKGYYGIIPHQKAIEYGVKLTGATVHFVDINADEGPIIMQKAIEVKVGDTPESLQKRVMEEVEWEILPKTIKYISEDRVKIVDRTVHIDTK